MRVRSVVIEISVYSLLVVVYVLVVLNFLSGWLKGLFEHGRTRYAVISLILIVGQGLVLEAVTSALLRLVAGKNE